MLHRILSGSVEDPKKILQDPIGSLVKILYRILSGSFIGFYQDLIKILNRILFLSRILIRILILLRILDRILILFKILPDPKGSCRILQDPTQDFHQGTYLTNKEAYYKAEYYTVIKNTKGISRTQRKCRKHEAQASVFYIKFSKVFSNVQCFITV